MTVRKRMKAWLAKHPAVPFTAKELGDRFGCTPANITYIVRALRRLGWDIQATHSGQRSTRSVTYVYSDKVKET